MNETSDNAHLVQGFAALASRAGAAILACRGTKGRLKPDGSPVCAGDQQAEDIILAGLRELAPGLPVVSEESFDAATATAPDLFILVDPLDGTREFLSGSDDFTVNIAVIRDGRPVLGCLYAPAHEALWLANGDARRFRLTAGAPLASAGAGAPARTRPWHQGSAIALTSHSHVSAADRALVARFGAQQARGLGSSLKFALIASGEADLYPRTGRIMAWDIAAGHAVLAAAGGDLVSLEGAALDYRRLGASFAQHGFIAVGDTRALAAI
jgi:3'(2'), 5'-bisphosphate nucleotidase